MWIDTRLFIRVRPRERAIAVQLALDGFWLGEAFGTAALTRAQRAALRDSLMALAQPEAGANTRRRKPTPRKGNRT